MSKQTKLLSKLRILIAKKYQDETVEDHMPIKRRNSEVVDEYEMSRHRLWWPETTLSSASINLLWLTPLAKPANYLHIWPAHKSVVNTGRRSLRSYLSALTGRKRKACGWKLISRAHEVFIINYCRTSSYIFHTWPNQSDKLSESGAVINRAIILSLMTPIFLYPISFNYMVNYAGKIIFWICWNETA